MRSPGRQDSSRRNSGKKARIPIFGGLPRSVLLPFDPAASLLGRIFHARAWKELISAETEDPRRCHSDSSAGRSQPRCHRAVAASALDERGRWSADARRERVVHQRGLHARRCGHGHLGHERSMSVRVSAGVRRRRDRGPGARSDQSAPMVQGRRDDSVRHSRPTRRMPLRWYQPPMASVSSGAPLPAANRRPLPLRPRCRRHGSRPSGAVTPSPPTGRRTDRVGRQSDPSRCR